MEKEKLTDAEELEKLVKDYFNHLGQIAKAIKVSKMPGSGLELREDNNTNIGGEHEK